MAALSQFTKQVGQSAGKAFNGLENYAALCKDFTTKDV
jgi:hypothetical protein